ncbi:SprT family zinc-dependent metalloprotease [Salinimonas marina]|uniref:SprT family zinc-dependent metalloprotease n=1 Tax=Salinimonas marina TaxID=2785918 RepID=A0A7S9DZM6_9ALTE|nr:SprT family zinc-dependent metalloprotease [Salinimonas marina]QPG06852.1 SprT family zinc-dependent metalloprotease [Salinimonas marina]
MTSPCQHDKLRVEQQVDELLALASSVYHRAFIRPTITWRKSGKNAGTSNLTYNRINLNPVLFHHNREAYLNDVVAHELSHILVYQLYGKVRPHGREWQTMMEKVFERPAATTHAFDLSPLQLKSYRYFCRCGPVQLSVRRHNKVMRQQQSYVCRRCHQQLQPAPSEVAV